MNANTRNAAFSSDDAVGQAGSVRGWASRRLPAAALSLVITLGLAGSAMAGMDRITWAELPERVADQLVPADQLRLADWSEARGASDPQPAIVLQYIENTFYQWEEHKMPANDGEMRVSIRMIRPQALDLTIEEAQVLLSGSRLYLDGLASTRQAQTLDPDDPEFDADDDDIYTDGDPGAFDPTIDPDGLFDEGPDGDEAVARQVNGADNRQRVGDTTAFPYRTISYMRSEYPNGVVARGTGTVVGPYMVLTNGHVVYNTDRGGFAESVSVSPGQWQTAQGEDVNRPYGSKNATRLETNSRYTQTRQFGDDYAAALLPEPFDGINTYIPLVFNVSPSFINLAGYPKEVQSESNSRTLWKTSGSIESVTSQLLRFMADVTGGNSGGPVWTYSSSTSTRRIVGLVAFSGSTSNGGPRLTSENLDIISGWMNWRPDGSGNGNGGGNGGSDGGNGGNDGGSSDDRYEQNDSFDDAATISTGTYSLQGLDQDNFKVTTREGKVTVSISGSSGDLDLSLWFKVAGEWEEVKSRSSDSNETITRTVPAGRTFIRVEPYNGETAAYTLRVRFTPKPSSNSGNNHGGGSGGGSGGGGNSGGGNSGGGNSGGNSGGGYTGGGSSGGNAGLCGVATPLTLTATLVGMFGLSTGVRRRRF